MKKALSILLAIAMLLAATSCGGGSAPAASAAPAPAGSPGEPVEIVIWHSMTGAMAPVMDKLISDYNASQSGVKVVGEFQGNYYDMSAKLQAAISSGSTPNIAQLEMTFVKQFVDFGAIADMTEAAKTAGLDLTQFFPGLLTSCTYDGLGLFALPFNRSTPMMYYNADMFKEVGLDPENPPKTWADLREYAKKLSIADKRWGCEIPVDAWFYEAFIMASGSQILNADETDIAFENKAGTDPLYLWRDMIAEGSMKAPPGQEFNSWEAARNDFAANITGIIVGSSGDLRTLTASCKFDLRNCRMPGNPKTEVPTGGANLAALAGHDDELAATVDFLKYLTSPEQAATLSAATGYVPVSNAAAETETYKAFLKEFPIGGNVISQLNDCTNLKRPFSAKYPEFSTTIMVPEIQRCIEKADYTPEMAVKTIAEQARILFKP